MGVSYNQDNGPKMCFNGAQSWQLGWYNTRHDTFTLSDGTWTGRLIGQVDQNNPSANPTDKVILRIDTSTSTDYYVSFGILHNIGTQEAVNQVTVTKMTGDTRAQTLLVAKLSGGGVYTIPNFDNSGNSLRLTVETINTSNNPGYADINVFVPTVESPPTKSPVTASPVTAPVVTCQKADVGQWCEVGSDCCSGLCSGGKKSNRKCLSDSPTPTSPTPSDPPVSSPIGTTCEPRGVSCSSGSVNCCNGCSGGKRDSRVCL